MISILVTYYNQEKYVSRSLDSIFAQNLTEEFEVLVGDDGSQDGTCKIVNDYMEKYPGKIKLNIQPRDVTQKYNPVERASKNRLDLLKMAKGEFVCFLDGDDEYCDFNWIQESIDILKKDKTLVGVAHNFCEKFSDGRVEYPSGIENNKQISSKLYCRKLYTPAGTIVFRNTFTSFDYEKLVNLKSFDDNDITFYFLNSGNLYCDNKCVYTYYQNDNSIWHSANELEKFLINAIDYEILKKILIKNHFQLFLKYYAQVYNVFRMRIELSNEKYDKYHSQALKNGDIYKLLCWNKQSLIVKVYLKMKFFTLKVFQYILERIF